MGCESLVVFLGISKIDLAVTKAVLQYHSQPHRQYMLRGREETLGFP